jgi:signal transduction histidine kinase
MKLKWKIFSLCLSIYLITLSFTAIIVSRSTYLNLLENEIQRSLEEEGHMHRSIALYLLVSQKNSTERIDIQSYSSKIIDIYSSKNNELNIFSKDGNLLSSSIPGKWAFKASEIEEAFKGEKTYILRRQKDSYYLFINDVIEFNNDKLLLSYIKDISHINHQKRAQYIFFLRAGFLGFILISLITALMSSLLIKPIDNLISVTKDIAAGNYDKRAQVTAYDEIGILAEHFNSMACEVYKKVNELEEEASRKQRFIDNLTHELRTPLTSIIGYSDLLKNMKYDASIYEKGLSYINLEGNRMLKLITTLMDFIMLREHTLKLEKHSVLSLLHEIVDIMSMKAADKDIKLVIQGEDFTLHFDWDILKSLLINLVDNAIKASAPGSVITLGLNSCYNDKNSYLYVKDTGKGMDGSELAKVLEPFYRIDKSRSRKEGGLGLGLSIVKAIVDAHGANMNIESSPGEGTKVSVIFTREGVVAFE